MSPDTILLIGSLFFAAVAAIAAWRSVKEGTSMIAKLEALSTATAAETAAQQSIAATMQTVADKTETTARLLNTSVDAAHVQAEIDSLVRVASALGEVSSACERIYPGGQPEFLFLPAREALRAAVMSLQSAADLQKVKLMVAANQWSGASPHIDGALREVSDALSRARERYTTIAARNQ